MPAPPLYIQEKVHPKVLIDDLLRQSKARKKEAAPAAPDLFADFNGLPDKEAATEFYQHDAHWTNRLIVGDSLQVMASLAEREGLRGQVQCIYFDPPYGIKFNSNFQWSTTSRDVKDGSKDHISREPEQVRAFRDTWRDGIHSYLSYLRDRLTVARDLLSDSGSIFVQIGDENVHRVRAVMDEVFGEDNLISQIQFKKTGYSSSDYLSNVFDTILWYGRNRSSIKYRPAYAFRGLAECDPAFFDTIEISPGVRRQLTRDEKEDLRTIPTDARLLARNPLVSPGVSATSSSPIEFQGKSYPCPPNAHWKTTPERLKTLVKADRLIEKGRVLRMVRYLEDNQLMPRTNLWTDTGTGGFVGDERVYVVQTDQRAIARCILMTTDPGDLVLDPTCGSGTTAYVAEQWGRRWITIDTSRVAAALARSRIMGARYPFYLLADSPEGQKKEAEVTRTAPKQAATHGNIRHGFVYERVPHITLKSIANNAEIDVIWDKWQLVLEPLRTQLNAALAKKWEEWEIPREADAKWPAKAKDAHAKWWEARIGRQKEIDASIAAKAEFEYLYDRPYADDARVRVAGPFTVESLSPHRVLAVDEDDGLFDEGAAATARQAGAGGSQEGPEFTRVVLDNLQKAGVQQAHKEGKIAFTSLQGWPGGDYICAEGRYLEGDKERRAGIFIGPEFGTVARQDLVMAAREAADAGFDMLIACAFNYDAHSSEFEKLGRIPVLKARMHPDLHMAGELKNTGAGNLFVVFGEPDIVFHDRPGNELAVEIRGVDIFRPQTGKVETSEADELALWMVDTDYNGESFFVRHAYFLGANDPYKALKTTLKAEIDKEAWDSLHSAVSRPFAKPKSGRIAVKVINHLGDEVMKVYGVK
ncbi:MAG: site-specific DNA-methyltransferase [Magnetospirillum sp.]|nr:site-specific DNA-methyltransferase [Magnetospirillum sp.]